MSGSREPAYAEQARGVALRVGRETVNRLAGQLSIAAVDLFTDMTGTQLIQTDDGSGFSRQLAMRNVELLEAGGRFVVVSGDSAEVVRAQFVRHLPPSSKPVALHVVSGSGYEIHRYGFRPGANKWSGRRVARGLEVSLDARERLLSRLLSLVVERLPSADLARRSGAFAKRLLSPRGARVDLRDHGVQVDETLYAEVTPNKVTLYAPRLQATDLVVHSLLDAVAVDRSIRRLSTSNGLNVIRGENFVDLISSTKSEGLAAYFERCESGSRSRASGPRWALVLGDGANDRDLFHAPALDRYSRVVRVFVGREPRVVAPRPTWGDDFIVLPGESTRGTEYVMERLAGGSINRAL
ncbi:MAG TPA: hypothetical protein PLV92_01470 [Pirellulaceae bacterium]|nr:hypothetical protein [Pirellulaceae bacterium]